jgi:hypothetical protein
MLTQVQVALKKVIDDVSVLAVEGSLVQKLPTLFPPEDIHDLSASLVNRVAGEKEATTAERKRLEEKLKVLEKGMAKLRPYVRSKIV